MQLQNSLNKVSFRCIRIASQNYVRDPIVKFLRHQILLFNNDGV